MKGKEGLASSILQTHPEWRQLPFSLSILSICTQSQVIWVTLGNRNWQLSTLQWVMLKPEPQGVQRGQQSHHHLIIYLPEVLHQWQHLKQKFTSNVNAACVIFFHHHLPFFPLKWLSPGWSHSIARRSISRLTTPETHTTIRARSWDDIRRQTCRINRRRTQMAGRYWCLRNNNTRWQWQRLSTDLENPQTKSVYNIEEKIICRFNAYKWTIFW